MPDGALSWDDLQPAPPRRAGVEPGPSARQPSGLQSQPPARTWYERAGDAAKDAFLEYSPMAALGRALGTYDPTLSDPEEHASLGYTGEAEARAARIAAASRANREAIAQREALDPAWQQGGSFWGNVGREAANFGGMAVGGAVGDPTSAIAPGEGLLAKMFGQAAVGGLTDAAVQGAEMGQGVRDEYDPLQTGISAAGGAGLVGLAHGAGKLLDVWRGVPSEPGAAIPDLQDVTLDGAPRAAGVPDVRSTLESVGLTPEHFSTPELAAAMAERVAGARARPVNVGPDILQERAGLQDAIASGETDPSFAPPPLPPRVLPDDVTLTAHPEGAVRSDEVGSLIGLMRNLAANQNVLEQAQARAADNPALRHILETNASTQAKIGPLWERLQRMNDAPTIPAESPLAVDRSTELPPHLRPTVEQARGETEGVVLPVKGRISSGFGARKAPTKGASTMHEGVDIAAPRGSAVAAPHAGTVVTAGEVGPNGNLVRIDHGNGVVTSYAHLDSVGVKIGQKVNAGDALGTVGSTGRSTGPHLHYQVRENGVAVDPQKFRFGQEPKAEVPYRVGDQGNDPFDQAQGPGERADRPTSPTSEELEQGKVYRDRRDGTFHDEPGFGRTLYEHPMGTSGNRPFKDVSPEQDRPEFRAPEDGSPAPDGTPPRTGTSFHEDVNQQRMDEMLREYEASQSRRREQQSRDRQQQAGPDPSERYKKHGQKPHQEGDFWHTTDDGMVADKDGNPVAFRNAREAAKWATANKMAGDFELHSWGTNSERVVLKRRENSTYGEAPPRPEGPQEPAAGRSTDETQRGIEGPRPVDSSPPDVDAKASSPEPRPGAAPGPASESGARPSPRDAYEASRSDDFRSPVNNSRHGPIEARSIEGDPVAVDKAIRAEADKRYSTHAERTAFANGAHGHDPFGAQAINADRGKVLSAWEAGMEHGRSLEKDGLTETNHQVATDTVTPSREPLQGKSETVVTPAGRSVDVQHEVRELGDVRQAKGDMQPRDRSRDASDVQVNDIASKLDPEQLHSNRQAAHGAPIITDEGHLATGNGRHRAIERAYEQHPERAAAYRKMIEDQGFDTKGFERPILVRRMKEKMPPEEMRKFVNEAQDSGTMRYSAPEQAKADAGAVSDEALQSYRGGDVHSAGNRDFVKRWMEETRADKNAMLASDGTLSAEGQHRIRASILAKAFDDETLVGKLLGDSDNNIKAIGTALTDLAPKFAQVKALAKDGRIAGEFDISGKVAEMAGLISRARAEGTKLADLIGQKDIFSGDVDAVTESLVRLMFKDDDLAKPRAGTRIKEGLDFYLEGAKATEEGKGMFGDDIPDLKPVDVLEAARAKLDAKDSPPGQGSFYKVVSEKERAANVKLSDRSLKSELKRLRGDMDPEQRDLADRLADAIGDDSRLTYSHLGDRGPGKTIAGQADVEEGRVYVARPGDIETTLHETVHLALIKRYGEEFSELRPGDAGHSPALEMVRLYNEARKRYGKYGFWNRKAAGHTVEYALSNVDEFVAEALSSPSFQRWLQRGTIWNRMMDGFRKVLGLSARFKPMLEDAIRSGHQLLEAVKKDTAGEFRPGSVFGRKGLASKIVDKDGLTRDAERIRNAIGDPGKVLATLGRRIKDGVAWTMFSNDARGRMVADRIESKAAHELLDNFFAAPGKLDAERVDRTYHEAVQRFGNGRSQEAFRALEGITGNPASERRVVDLLRFPNKTTKATAAELEAAKKVRALLKETIDYRKAAGEEIGEVGDGYFPRWLDVDKVMAKQDEFLAAAQKVYQGIGLDRKEAKDAAQRWLEHSVDTYAGLDAGLDLYNVAGDTVGSRTSKGREFGKQADAMLAEFYQDEALPVLAQYFHGSARRAEMARRFGKKGPVGSPERAKWEKEHGDKTQLEVLEDRIREDARAHDGDGAGAMGVLRNIYGSNLGRVSASMSTRQRQTVAWAHTWTQLGVMDRAVVTSLAEMITGGFTRGGMKQGLPFIRESMKQYVRQLRHAAPDDAQRWAEALGIAQDAMVNEALTARASIEGGTQGSQKVLKGYYNATTLHQYTEGTRIAAVKMSKELLRQWSHDLASSSARVSSRAKKYLGEVGIKDAEAFGKRIREGGFELEDVRNETSAGAREYATAVMRITNQAIMRPTRAEKPAWATHPVGSMFFSLMSYSYGFKKNVLDRVGRLTAQAAKDKDPTMLAPLAGLMLMTGWQGLMDTYIRPAIFGGGPPKDESPMQAGIRIADRAGLDGGLSPLVNALTGVKYRRSLSESLLGPVIGRPLDMGTKFVELAVNNTPHTNTAERNAAGAVYDNLVEPGIDGLASARLLGAARTGVVMGTGTRDDKGVLPSDREAFIEALAGPKKHKKGD